MRKKLQLCFVNFGSLENTGSTFAADDDDDDSATLSPCVLLFAARLDLEVIKGSVDKPLALTISFAGWLRFSSLGGQLLVMATMTPFLWLEKRAGVALIYRWDLAA